MIDMNKKYQLIGGAEVRLYAVDGNGRFPVHGAYRNANGGWSMHQWTLEGESYTSQYHIANRQHMSLVEIPDKPEDLTYFSGVKLCLSDSGRTAYIKNADGEIVWSSNCQRGNALRELQGWVNSVDEYWRQLYD